ncbi:MAG: hypothetical protein V1808_02240 [Candidatus Daviesbacteria bacterium]
MKKVTALLITGSWFLTATTVLAAVNFEITAPLQAVDAEVGIVINNALKIVFGIAGLLVLVFLIMGAFQWITSGGDKDGIAKARDRITHALIGLLILVLSFVIITFIGNIIGVELLKLDLPSLDQE